MRQSPGSMRRGTTAGGTTALTDDPSIPLVSRSRHRTNVQKLRNRVPRFGWFMRRAAARRPRGCRGRTSRRRPARTRRARGRAPRRPRRSSARGRDGGPARRAARPAGAPARRSSWASSCARGEHVALDARGVVGLEREVDRRARGGGARDGDRGARRRPLRGGDGGREGGVDVGAQRRQLRGGGRVGAQVALGVADDADLRRDVEADPAARAAHELGRAAADVDHEALGRVVGRAQRGGARVRQRRLLVPAQRARRRTRAARRSRAAKAAPSAASRTAEVRTAVARRAAVRRGSPPRSGRARRARAPAPRGPAGRSRRPRRRAA